ncbi:DUF1559 domain-containing protein [Blastopirellula marina]|uniref:DUF1559 domain-containing protein n=1 Tax=Blastopirellula marina TaxID=124 RepID=A0A2S8GTD4_9BACT|nr:DUF1559 domain-containing protein [Blastopirellula marina]PQO47685.1 hypothetical protein C5Y93_03250 [Blastopirellula marina]
MKRLKSNSIFQRRRGMTLVDLLTVSVGLLLIAAVLLPAVSQATASSERQTCTENLRKLGTAFHDFAETRQGFPPRRTGIGAKLPYGGWGAQILPLVRPDLGDQFDSGLDYYDEANQAVASKSIDVFVCPSSPKDRTLTVTASTSPGSRNPDKSLVFSFKPGLNDYIAANGLWMPDSGYGVNWSSGGRGSQHQAMTDSVTTPFHKITDGLANTILVVEKGGLPDEWIKGKRLNESSPIGGENSRGTWAGFGSIVIGVFDGETGKSRGGKGDSSDCTVNCNNFHGIYGFHNEGANILLCDGSVRFVTPELDGLTLGRLITCDDGQPIDPRAF